MTDKSHLDEEALAELQDVMEDEFEVLIQTYVSDSRERIAALKRALEHQDADAFAKTAHSFKGSCINIGAPRLGELCLEAEQAGKSEDLTGADAIIQRIEEEFRTVSEMLGELLVR
ncbi:Hpt domain-containing protein [Marinobacter koreensis]|jgi:HPt (histidine-containing phosphotransfer) domain-containing protein|uniref:Hpt domain-containing protein n=1 Tax=Marinobacter koreensis TaxID=335974 RepID=A0ABW0RHV7_9GAMM|nr:Hpt domain-containing protein [Marinobacter koreensis]MCK7547077.1 Hpt domain-containing protein [Marinobacter koreensis]